MKNRFIIIIGLLMSHIVAFAQYTDRGRPTDLPGHSSSDGFIGGIFIVLAIIALLIIGGIWIYSKIQENKESINKGCGEAIGGLILVGGVFFLAFILKTCNEAIKDSSNSKQENIEKPNNTYQNGNSSNNEKTLNNTYTPPPKQLKYRYVEYYENCSYCYGRGEIACARCNGTGKIKYKCPKCNGRGDFGYSICSYCHGQGKTGSGYYAENLCLLCGGNGKTKETCYDCFGTGYQSDDCVPGDIEISFSQHHYFKCSHCNGQGTVRQVRQESYYD